jgi:hypothetical protein
MRDSSVYQAILAEGRGEERIEGLIQGELAALRRTLKWFGEQRFGAPRAEDETILNSIGDVARLERMIHRSSSATDWTDLLATP